jgi:hypothetical protein
MLNRSVNIKSINRSVLITGGTFRSILKCDRVSAEANPENLDGRFIDTVDRCSLSSSSSL